MQERFEVTKILDGNTFEVTPFWEWQDENGNRVQATGYEPPAAGEPGYEAMQNSLMELLFGERVALTDPEAIKDDALVCTLQVNGQNLAEHFPGYRE